MCEELGRRVHKGDWGDALPRGKEEKKKKKVCFKTLVSFFLSSSLLWHTLQWAPLLQRVSDPHTHTQIQIMELQSLLPGCAGETGALGHCPSLRAVYQFCASIHSQPGPFAPQ